MKKTKTEVYCCEYCGKLYFSLQEVTDCELACKRAEKHNKWYEEHKPEYEVGDVVELWSTHGHANKFFTVQEVRKNPEFPAWVYYGASGGYDSYGDYDTRAVVENYTDEIKRRVMTASEYCAWCDDIRKRLPNKYYCEFSLLDGEEFGLSVSVFRESDKKDDLG